jgi:cytochrome c oxidase subunit IV
MEQKMAMGSFDRPHKFGLLLSKWLSFFVVVTVSYICNESPWDIKCQREICYC